MRDVSVLMPARNEMFLQETINSVLENIEADTEVIVILDGAWPITPIEDHERVVVVYLNESIGQRAATNLAARMSTAKFVMKLDAHCSVDKGFDRKLMEDCEYEWTVIPRQYNLHAFNWKCKKCGNEWYQGPTPKHCQLPGEGKGNNPNCDSEEFERVMVWKKRENKKADFMRFDKDLHFQYWGSYGERPEAQGDIADTMSCLGACWFLHRERYWDLEGMDEAHGSWGQMGTELACKSWLSGGRMVVNKKTWFAHMFRTQGGDFGFPYPLSGKQVDQSRKYSQDIWKNNKWSKAIYDLNWLIDRFSPIPGWNAVEKPKKKPTKGVVYYTDNEVDEAIGTAVRKQILKGIKEKHVVSVSLKPINFGKNIVLNEKRGYLTMAKQILAGLEASTADVVFFCEHDVLYDPSHFDFIPEKKDVYYYNENVWQVRLSDGHALYHDVKKLSQICAWRKTLIKHYRERVKRLEKDCSGAHVRAIGFEPGTHNRKERVDNLSSEVWKSRVPNIDIRHDKNLTPSRWKKEQFKNQKYTRGWKESDGVQGWGTTEGSFSDLIRDIAYK